MNWRRILHLGFAGLVGITCAGAGSNWKQHVSGAERVRVNPYAGQAKEIAAGARLYGEYCAQCHASDALGQGRTPSLRTRDVQESTDGELLWLMKNGERGRGMPSWNALPQQSRGQVVAFVKSLGVSGTAKPSSREKEGR